MKTMKIEVTCRENDNYHQVVDVYELDFNPKFKTFSMSYCMGDCWGLELRCPLDTSAISFESQANQLAIRFGRQEEAEAFAGWLIEGNKTVVEGYRTMRG
jgi:hypothetical protein